MLEELKVLKDVCGRLNAANIPYMLSGSIALNYYAEPRMTRDIDVVVNLDLANAKKFISLFAGDYYVDEEMISAEIARGGMFNLIHNETVIKIDFILKKSGEYNQVEFDRKKQVEIDGVKIWIISPEDLIVAKLNWARDSLSELQLKDVRSLWFAVENLDKEYISKWVEKLGISGLLDKATA